MMRWGLLAVFASCGGAAATGAATESPRAVVEVAHVAAPETLTPQAAAVLAAQRTVAQAQAQQQETTSVQSPAAVSCEHWPLWERYARTFIDEDGRVVDITEDGRSTSEGQSYALFFALVAGDRARFDRILSWTTAQLAQGNLSQHLPAWHWGKREDGTRGVVDANAAADADLWIAYTLLEAARIWKAPTLREVGKGLAQRIVRDEVVRVKGLGMLLLPGPKGFVLEDGSVRLNTSYLVLPILRRFVDARLSGPWSELIETSERVLSSSAPRGLSPDWITYTAAGAFVDDANSGALGSYDAIRVYLWSALLPRQEPHRTSLIRSATALAELVDRTGRVPERIQAPSAEISQNEGPPGFIAVALAAATATGNDKLAAELASRLQDTQHDGLYGEPARYYDQNLALFALGFVEKRFAFGKDGKLQLSRLAQECKP